MSRQLSLSGTEWRRKYESKYRNDYLLKQHSITLDEYNTILHQQNNVCAICFEPETRVHNKRITAFAVDHDHRCCPGKSSCGKCIRGLLCYNCNTLLGRAKDKITTLQSAIVYLRRENVVAAS